jgi:hypothetical protein
VEEKAHQKLLEPTLDMNDGPASRFLSTAEAQKNRRCGARRNVNELTGDDERLQGTACTVSGEERSFKWPAAHIHARMLGNLPHFSVGQLSHEETPSAPIVLHSASQSKQCHPTLES